MSLLKLASMTKEAMDLNEFFLKKDYEGDIFFDVIATYLAYVVLKNPEDEPKINKIPVLVSQIKQNLKLLEKNNNDDEFVKSEFGSIHPINFSRSKLQNFKGES